MTHIPGKSDLAKAFRYGLSRRDAFRLFLGDGRVAIDSEEDRERPQWDVSLTNPAERALRPIGVGRARHCARTDGASMARWLFAGSDPGGETLARDMTVIETAKMNGLDPQAYPADVLDPIHDHIAIRLDELLPWNWMPTAPPHGQAA